MLPLSQALSPRIFQFHPYNHPMEMDTDSMPVLWLGKLRF